MEKQNKTKKPFHGKGSHMPIQAVIEITGIEATLTQSLGVWGWGNLRTDLLNMIAVHVAREDLLVMICRYPIPGLTAFSYHTFPLSKASFSGGEKTQNILAS